ncbi:MAG: hypothetical protein AAGI38_06790 [Bacteroidota bacterium]
MKTYIKLFISIFSLFSVALIGCDDPAEGNQQADASVQDTVTDRGIESTLPEEAQSLMGSWEMVAQQIAGESLPVGRMILTFEEEGLVTIATPDEPDISDLITAFSYENGSVSYDGGRYDIESLSPDSLVLINEIDGEKVYYLYKRAGALPQ